MNEFFYFIMGAYIVIASISLKKDYEVRKRLKIIMDEMEKIINKQGK
jgi:hypothetical protein